MFTKSLVAGLCLTAVLVSAEETETHSWLTSTTSPTKVECGKANASNVSVFTVPMDPLPKGAKDLWEACDDLDDIKHCPAGLMMCADKNCRVECSGNEGPKTYINAAGKACGASLTSRSPEIYHCADDTACLKKTSALTDAKEKAKEENCCDDNEAKKCPAGMNLCADKSCQVDCVAVELEEMNCLSVCAGHCGETTGLTYKSDFTRSKKDFKKGDKCYCDSKCVENNDCCDPDEDFSYTGLCGCEDKSTNCQSSVALVDDEGGNTRTNGKCYCDEFCEANKDCCQDDFNYDNFCKGGVCTGHCDEEIIVRGNVKCFCDAKCAELGDCCQGFDYNKMC